MKLLKNISLIFSNLVCLQYCSGFNFPVLCKSQLAPTKLELPDVEEIRSFLSSQPVTKKLLEDVTDIELKMFEKATDNEDKDLHVIQLAAKYGYKIDEENVKTKDGYILTIHRIKGKGTPVLLQIGLGGSSDDWITGGPGSCLAYLLADNGYDVWMGNTRGTKHSMKHVSMSPECGEFWNYSYDDLGRYDMPDMIDHILHRTCKSKLVYVGFSQGTTSFFVMASVLPKYNNKISLMAAISPATDLAHSKSPLLRLLVLQNGLLYSLGKAIGFNKILSNEVVIKPIREAICADNAISKEVCGNFINILCGFDAGNMNISNLPTIVGHFPTSASLKEIEHLVQGIRSKKFRRFDYGADKNTEVYGTDTPPEYPLDKVTAPVALFCGDIDLIVNVTDVQRMKDTLPNVVDFQVVKDYNHVDFVWAKTVREFVYLPLLELIKKYS